MVYMFLKTIAELPYLARNPSKLLATVLLYMGGVLQLNTSSGEAWGKEMEGLELCRTLEEGRGCNRSTVREATRVLHSQLCDLADLMLFDEKGNKTSTPDKERQIEALQLLFLILPAPNRSLLKLLLDLLYQTAKKQDKNKMSAHNLALMFAPHILWPRNVSNLSICWWDIAR